MLQHRKSGAGKPGPVAYKGREYIGRSIRWSLVRTNFDYTPNAYILARLKEHLLDAIDYIKYGEKNPCSIVSCGTGALCEKCSLGVSNAVTRTSMVAATNRAVAEYMRIHSDYLNRKKERRQDD